MDNPVIHPDSMGCAKRDGIKVHMFVFAVPFGVNGGIDWVLIVLMVLKLQRRGQ